MKDVGLLDRSMPKPACNEQTLDPQGNLSVTSCKVYAVVALMSPTATEITRVLDNRPWQTWLLRY